MTRSSDPNTIPLRRARAIPGVEEALRRDPRQPHPAPLPNESRITLSLPKTGQADETED